MFHVRGIIRIFFRGGGGAPIFVTFSSVVFLVDLILSNVSNKNDSRGIQGHAAPEVFENLLTAMAMLVLFEQFLRKVCHIFGP